MKSLLLLTALMLSAAARSAEPPSTFDPDFDRYAKPARVVVLQGGRTFNIDCRGSGDPTVLLFAGLASWSEVWAKLHDRIAAHQRVCAFDPAGFGFSGPATGAQGAGQIVADLEAALGTARIAPPYVLVGHSAGGLQALTFADRHKPDTLGMVLVDPSYPGVFADFDRVAPHLSRTFREGADRKKASYERCAEELQLKPIAPTSADARSCFLYRPTYSEALRAALAANETPARMRTKMAQMDGFAEASASTVDPRRNYAGMPLIVLTRGQLGPPPGAPAASAEMAAEGLATDKAWVAAHRALSELSTRGEHRSVEGAGHMIPLEKPEAVVTAVEDVLKTIRR